MSVDGDMLYKWWVWGRGQILLVRGSWHEDGLYKLVSTAELAS